MGFWTVWMGIYGGGLAPMSCTVLDVIQAADEVTIEVGSQQTIHESLTIYGFIHVSGRIEVDGD